MSSRSQIITFRVLHDPGHGWLEVPEALSRCVGIKPEDYSPFSYIKRNNPADNLLYLEEDLDAGFFITAFEKTTGGKINIDHRFEDPSTVRGLPHLSGANYSFDHIREAIKNAKG